MNPTRVRCVLGFDYGKQRIGLATGQTITGTATPLTTLNAVRQQPDWERIADHIRQWRPQALIVGIPYRLDGSSSEASEAALIFADRLEKRFRLPVYTVNESLTSFEAEARLKQDGKISQHNKGEVDKMAAAIIVQSWLDQQT
jgi:putative Holliday junction resolvase